MKIETQEIQSETGEIIIPNGANAFINDIGANPSWLKRLDQSLKVDTVFLEPDQLTTVLEEKLSKNLKIQRGVPTIALYPREGALQIKDRWNVNNALTSSTMEFDIVSKRDEPNTDPSIELPDNLVSDILDIIQYSPLQIVVVDDVVASGRTAKTIRNVIEYERVINAPPPENNDRDTRFTPSSQSSPSINWFIATWLSLKKSNQVKNLSQYSAQIYAYKYSGINRRPPLNSLSTLIKTEPRYQQIRNAYATTYAKNINDFFNLLNNFER